jgi:hypothetical protein
MRCPKCQFDHALQTTECLKCGIVFARYLEALECAAKRAGPALPMAVPALLLASAPASDRNNAVMELRYRALALPLALLVARLIDGTGLRIASAMLAMVLHESGHAITAWLTGRWAIPLLWVTPHGEERSWAIVLVLTATIVLAGFLTWKAQRWGWVLAASAVLILQVIFLNLPAGAAIVFCGDGGAMVLATILMAMFYAPRESALCKSWGLLWGLLVIGALSFMHVFSIWTVDRLKIFRSEKSKELDLGSYSAHRNVRLVRYAIGGSLCSAGYGLPCVPGRDVRLGFGLRVFANVTEPPETGALKKSQHAW